MNDNFLKATIGQYGLIIKDRKILLLQRPNSKEWALPGGRLDNNEEPRVGLKREILEETNLLVEVLEPVDVYIYKDEFQLKYCIYFNIEVKNIDDLKLSKEHKEFKWFDVDDLEKVYIDGRKEITKIIKENIKL